MTGICQDYLAALKQAGAEKAQCVLTSSERHIMAFEAGRISMFRTSRGFEAGLTAISNGRWGSSSSSALDAAGIASAAGETLSAAAASVADPARDITPSGPAGSLDNGVAGPDAGKMFDRLAEFLSDIKLRYPCLKFRTAHLSFSEEKKVFSNSIGLSLEARTGLYELLLIFCSAAKGRTSNFNHFIGCARDLSKPLMSWGGVDRLFEQSAEHMAARPLEGKFHGDIVVSPECLWDFLSFVTNDALRDNKMISGMSVYKGRIGERVAHRDFTLRSLPGADSMAAAYPVTKEGERTENADIMECGVLKNCLLSRYAAAKTGLRHVRSDGECYVVEPGKSELGELISSVKKGLLVTRFSGATPNERGDFSGIAKNSFYIENGRVLFPISETMISGNVPEMLKCITGISRERINSGYSIYPWISFSGINISGK
ncbi:MAG: metallopeptidase TldD-related protein [Elusimicrobiales bacterium]|nr:metallopeptidase TldD-related protein [Elusimicrobiales bacterium]